MGSGLKKIRLDDAVRAAETEIRMDPDEETDPAPPMRPAGQATDSQDPEVRADDETPPDVVRVLRRPAKS